MNLILRQMFIAIYDGSFDQENFASKHEGFWKLTKDFFKENLEKTIKTHGVNKKNRK